ncbi:glycine N-methyltransferase [Eurytemora carolleeae]|uniref:glycine N-methyltransferase n=1 Tax=Eurytemora carolleeae TaxID=1294199 RepID=UPI000C792F3D|nr:glycine N-methyltransferase [Eurytemora carolleeae]|eukprot:XP_023340081.1 glycine N-methyltransferase-like [Eurytemora affinis]
MTSSNKVDGVFRMRSLGTATPGISDQYADGKAAKVWQLYIGDTATRTSQYKNFLVNLLKENGVERVLDAACGTGVDSIMLIEQGFSLTSSDASDKMLKKAYKTRWERRKEPAFDSWCIEEGNWLTLDQDICVPEGGFDAVICMGNSFAHLPDFHGDQRDQRKCIENFYKLVRPGGIFIIDHRNYDYILTHGTAPSKNIYYNSTHIKDIKTSVLHVNNRPNLITLDYFMNVEGMDEFSECDQFRLSYYPHTLAGFTQLLRSAFGPDCKHSVYADFKSLEEEPEPSFYIHVIEK